MSSLARRRRRQLLWMAATSVALLALIAFNAFRPSPEAKIATDFTARIANRQPGDINPAERDELRQQWERFSPDTRKQVFLGVAREALERFREENAKLTPDGRAKRVQQEMTRLREHRDGLTEEQRNRIRERLGTAEAKEMVKNVLTFYQSELSAKERAELDPLVHEWLYQMEQRFSR